MLNIMVDDLRDAPDGWVLFKTAEAFLAWVDENPKIEFNLSLDHDLGPESLDGYALVKLLVEKPNHMQHVQIHSSNFVGAKNMLAYLQNAKKYGLIEADIDKRTHQIIGGIDYV